MTDSQQPGSGPASAGRDPEDFPHDEESSASTNPATGASAGGGSTRGGARHGRHSGVDQPSIVIRDRRRVRPHAAPAEAEAKPSGDQGVDSVPETIAGGETAAAEGAETAESAPTEPTGPFGAELEALRVELDERTHDLQRLSAEYANYRKRVDRDRALVSERAAGNVVAALLPVLDDLDRARAHGDLVGPFAVVADQLATELSKFGLAGFGEKGDPFDPTRHEAVAHLRSAEVTEPTCIEVLRRGYLLGDRLLRAALVAVADPEQD